MQNKTNRKIILGWHKPGRLSSTVNLFEFDLFMGNTEDSNFHSPESFLGLIASYHEAVHLFQDLYMGSSCLIDNLRNDYKEAVFNLFDYIANQHEVQVPFIAGQTFNLDSKARELSGKASFLYREIEMINPLFQEDTSLAQTLVNQLRSNPKLNDLLPLLDPILNDMKKLSGISLFECHAALHTQMFIEKLMALKPEAFDEKISKELIKGIDLDNMEEDSIYKLPYQIFQKVSNTFLHIDRFEDKFSVNSHWKHPIFAPMLAVILDISLHMPPKEFLIVRKGNDMYVNGDYSPACRFINTILNVIMYDYGKVNNFDLGLLYNFWVEEITPDFSFNDTTKEWIKHYELRSTNDQSGNMNRHLQAMRRRLESPNLWMEFDIRSEFGLLEIPISYETRSGPRSIGTMKLEGVTLEEIQKDRDLLTKTVMNSINSHIDLEEKEHRRAIEQDIADCLFIKGSIECSEAHQSYFMKSFGREKAVNCNAKRNICESSFNIKNSPKEGCLIRSILQEHNWNLVFREIDTADIQNFIRNNYEIISNKIDTPKSKGFLSKLLENIDLKILY